MPVLSKRPQPRRLGGPNRGKATLAWAVAAFVFTQLATDLVLDERFPEVHDPEFYVKLQLLKAQRARAPGRPLVVFLGSSRTDMSFLPELLPPLPTSAGPDALPFNGCHLGAGPAMNLISLRRLLRQGIRPDRLVVEFMPPQLDDASQNIVADSAGPDDLPTVIRCRGWKIALGRFVRPRLIPTYRDRAFLLGRIASGWLPSGCVPPDRQVKLAPLGGDFHWNALAGLTPVEVQQRTASAKANYQPHLQTLEVRRLSDRTWRELLSLCRDQRISVVLIMSPEGKQFQSWYSPEARARVDRYADRLHREFGVPVVDARNWLADDDFSDSHHVLLRGARAFTERLGREVLAPWLAGHPPSTASDTRADQSE